MRRLLLLVLLFGCLPAFAEKHEIGLTLGGLFPQDRGTIPNTVRLGGGTALQANYGHRLITGRVALYGEVHFLANPQRLVGSGNSVSTRDIATIYVTPGIRVKFAPTRSFSPYLAAGGGYAVYEQSVLQIDVNGPFGRVASHVLGGTLLQTNCLQEYSPKVFRIFFGNRKYFG